MSDLYEKAAAQMQQAKGLMAGYAPPPQATTAEQAIDFLLTRYGSVLEQHTHLRQRVWQLEAVNDNHLRARQELCDEVANLRERLARREDELAAAVAGKLAAEVVQGIAENKQNTLLERNKQLAEQVACVKPVVQAIYSWRGKQMQRELRVVAVQALSDGKIRIQVDLRGVSRVGTN